MSLSLAVVAAPSLMARLDQGDQGRLARECAKLDPDFERALAEEGFAEEHR